MIMCSSSASAHLTKELQNIDACSKQNGQMSVSDK